MSANSRKTLQEMFFSFEGRIGRADAWFGVLIGFAIHSVLISLIVFAGFYVLMVDESGQAAHSLGGMIILVFALVGLLCIPIFVKRLHDLNHSGFYVVLIAVPYLNILFIIYMLFFKGYAQENIYGPPPV